MDGFVRLRKFIGLSFGELIDHAFRKRWKELSQIPLLGLTNVEREFLMDPECLGIALPISMPIWAEEFENPRIPIVNISERLPPVTNAVNIRYDNDEMGRLAADHLREIGYTQFVFIGDGPSGYSISRHAGFKLALEQAGMTSLLHFDFPARNHLYPNKSRRIEVAHVQEWLKVIGKPAGIFTANDIVARTLIKAMDEIDPELRHSYGVVGVDDEYSREPFSDDIIPITSILPNFPGIGVAGAEALYEAVVQKRYNPGSIVRIRGAKLVQRETTGGFSCEDPLLAKISRWISKEINDGNAPNLNSIFDTFSISERALYDRFKRYRKEPLRDYMMRLRIQRAARMLLDSDLKISEIAQKCGFNKHADLSERFLKYMGCSPTDYRSQNKKQSPLTPVC